jgi:hypothetical protein
VVMGRRPTQGDEKRLGPATTLYRTVALPFVIPRSAAEGSAVPRTSLGNVFRPSVGEPLFSDVPLKASHTKTDDF